MENGGGTNGTIKVPGALVRLLPWVIALLLGGWFLIRELTSIGLAQYRSLPEKVSAIEKLDIQQEEKIKVLEANGLRTDQKLDRILERLPARRTR